MSKHPHYLNNTILEALCEIRFQLPTENGWNSKTPGELFTKLQPEFPGMEPITETAIELVFDKKTANAMQQRLIQGKPKIRFSNEENTKMVQVSQSNFSFNMINKDGNDKYPGWDIMKKGIVDNWNVVCNVLNNPKPSRFGLRYINKIPYIEGSSNIGDLLRDNSYIPVGLIRSKRGFVYRIETKISEEQAAMVSILDQEEDGYHFILFDIDRIINLDSKKVDPIEDVLEILHDDVWEIFKSAKTELLDAYLNRKD